MDAQDIQAIKQRFGIIGNAPKLNYAIRNAALSAPTDISVLITGESGSGKESFSKIIHQLSYRKHGAFIAINCGAIPVGTIDSELFGHEKGAFTGATDMRKGYFEVTNGGTIFLDEVGEMPLGTQARLLRVLENSEFIKVGSSKVQKTDVRIVAATNVDLLEKVQQQKFREDLYYRLTGVHIVVPPLRERGDDINLLFRKFASDFSEKHRVAPVMLDDQAQMVLQNYRFPGNIRQLNNLVNQLSVLEFENRQITAETLRKYLPDSTSSLPMLINKAEKAGLERAGANTSGNYSDRDLLYKILFDMRQEVTELKQLIRGLMQVNNAGEQQELMEEHKHLFHNISATSPSHSSSSSAGSSTSAPAEKGYYDPPIKNPYLLNPSSPDYDNLGDSSDISGYEDEAARVEDIPHREEEESLSLQDQERGLIVKALRKNNNKRKDAAQELGISQRTLYRKIKQYDIKE